MAPLQGIVIPPMPRLCRRVLLSTLGSETFASSPIAVGGATFPTVLGAVAVRIKGSIFHQEASLMCASWKQCAPPGNRSRHLPGHRAVASLADHSRLVSILTSVGVYRRPTPCYSPENSSKDIETVIGKNFSVCQIDRRKLLIGR